MDVEEVFSSKLRMKILKIIFRLGEVNVSEIARRLGVNYSTTKQHLEILENEGIIQKKRFGRIQLYRINQNSSKAKAIQNLIDVWEHK